MKDHRVGTFGAVGLILILGIKFLALNLFADEISRGISSGGFGPQSLVYGAT